VPGDGEGRGHLNPGLTPTAAAATNGTTGIPMLPDQGDPRRVGELLGDWLAIRMEEVDDLVDEASSRVDALPNQRVMWSLVGETLVLLRALELEVAELRKAVKR
jgi:hypothetical protein